MEERRRTRLEETWGEGGRRRRNFGRWWIEGDNFSKGGGKMK